MYSWLLCTVLCAGANAQGFSGGTIQSVGDALTSVEQLVDGGCYLMYNVGRATYLNEQDGGALYLNAHENFTNANTDADMNYVVRLWKDGDYWKIQLESGLYVPALLAGGAMASSATAEPFTVGAYENAGFYFNGTTNSYQLNGNGTNNLSGSSGSLTGWNKNETAGGNSEYKLYPVTWAEPLVTYVYPGLDGSENAFRKTAFSAVGNTASAPAVDYFTSTGLTETDQTVSETNATFHVTGQWTLPFSLDRVYRMKLRVSGAGGSSSDRSANFYYDAEQSRIGVRATTAGAAPDAFAKESLWYFKAAGGDRVTLHCLALSDAYGVTVGSVTCTLSASPTAFQVLPNAGTEADGDADGFNLRVSGNSCLNDINGVLGVWNAAASLTDAGSRFTLAALAADEIQGLDRLGTASALLGSQFPVNAALKTAAAAEPSVANVRALFLPVFSDVVDEGKYYRLTFTRPYTADGVSYGTLAVTGYAGADGTIADYADENNSDESTRDVTAAVKSAADVSQLWQFKANTDGGRYYLVSPNANGYYLGTPNGSASTSSTHITKVQAWGDALAPFAQDAAGHWTFQLQDGQNYICSSNTGANVLQYRVASDPGLPMEVEEVTSVSVSIGTTGYATLCLPFAVSVPEGVKAYTASGVGESGDVKYVKLVEVPDGQIPAGTGVILQAETQPTETTSFDFGILTTDVSAVEDNKLTGVTLSRHGYAAEAHYGLKAGADGEAVLAKNAEGVNVPSNKAVLPTSEVAATETGASVLSLRPETGGQTGIGGVEAAPQGEVRFYDLGGRRVVRPTRGVYVTGDGRKVFVK